MILSRFMAGAFTFASLLFIVLIAAGCSHSVTVATPVGDVEAAASMAVKGPRR